MKKIWINVLVLLIALVLVVSFLEAVVRVAGISPPYGYPDGTFQADEQLDFQFVPGASGVLVKQEFASAFSLNSLGMWNEELGDDDFRILALGDSFTFGAYGVSLEGTFVKVAEEELNVRSKSIFSVVNAGVPGYGTDQELAYLELHGIDLKPDMILLNFYVNNDFFDNQQSGELAVNEDGQLVVSKGEQTFPEKARTFLLGNFHSYRLVERGVLNVVGSVVGENFLGKLSNWKLKKDLYSVGENDAFTSAVEATLPLLDEMKQIADREGIPLVVMVIPAKFQVDEHLWEVFLRDNDLVEGARDKPQQVLLEWGEQQEVLVLDLLPLLQAENKDNTFYWTLNPHFNPYGQQVVGELLFSALMGEKHINPLLNIPSNEQQQGITCGDVGFPQSKEGVVASAYSHCLTSS